MSGQSFLGKLLDGVEVEWKALGDILVWTKGTNITAGQMKKLHKDGAPLKIFAGGKAVASVDYGDGLERKRSREAAKARRKAQTSRLRAFACDRRIGATK